MLIVLFFFFVLILSILFTIKPTNFKKSYSWICKKHDQPSINLTNVFDLLDNVCVLGGGVTLNTFFTIFFVYHVTIFHSSHMQHLRWSSLQKKQVMAGKCRWLLLHGSKTVKQINLSKDHKVFHLPYTCSKSAKKQH